jgi:hypothetical protein
MSWKYNVSGCAAQYQQRGGLRQVRSYVFFYPKRCAVTLIDADVGNDHLGLFGKPHVDTEDSPGSLTCMISCCNLPEDYEPGRFHLLHLGIFFVLRSVIAVGFSGLHRHVGTPPIASTPEVAPHATRTMFVLYPTQAGFPEKTSVVTPFASWPGGKVLSLGPEFTTFWCGSFILF